MLNDRFITLGIETSCDETAAAVLADERELLGNVVASQAEIHRRWGGVVPEVASRRHFEALWPTVSLALAEAGVGFGEIDLVAVTAGPGLLGSLMVGVSWAKSFAWARNIPFLGVNHLLGHIYANFLVGEVSFPLLSLVVSGGHTDLILLRDPRRWEVLGRSRDDAAGEAFDKVGRLLGLPYPGGPAVERLAREGDPDRVRLPVPDLGESLDFSFSGLKTAVLQRLGSGATVADLAAAFQRVVVGELTKKALAAARETGLNRIHLAGGVSANGEFRRYLAEAAAREGVEVFFPPVALCTDNAAMIAAAGYHLHRAGARSGLGLSPEAVLFPFKVPLGKNINRASDTCGFCE